MESSSHVGLPADSFTCDIGVGPDCGMHLLLLPAFGPQGWAGCRWPACSPTVCPGSLGQLPAQGQETVGSLGPGSERERTWLLSETAHQENMAHVSALSTHTGSPCFVGKSPGRLDPGQSSLKVLPFVGTGDRRSFSLHRNVGTQGTLNQTDKPLSSCRGWSAVGVCKEERVARELSWTK